ncbi:MAG: hypothetical protein KHY08_14135 [Lachnospiraceae bacterium]|nr:hypothetical protein [Lachnospiraceae bacterium]
MKANRTNMLKRTAAAVLCAAFLLPAALPAAVYAADVPAEAQTGAEKTLARIQLSVGDGQETPVFRAGEKAKLRISVKNTGNTAAQNVRIAPVIKSEADWPFELDQLNYDQDLGSVEAGGKADAVWGGGDVPLTVKDSVTGKAYKLTFRITYDDGEKAYEAEKYVFVKTEAKPGSSEEKPSGGTPSGDVPESGKPSGESPVSGGQTAGGGGYGSAAEPEAGSVYNSEPTVAGGGSASTSVPRVIVTGFSTEPGEVRAGSNFKLVVHLKNTSSRTGVSNMLFDFQAPSSGSEAAAEAPAFLPASGSSSIYLDSIPAGGTKDISIELNARADLVQKPYSISMSMKYEDSGAAQYEAQSSLAIPIRQEARFEFSKMQIAPDTVSVGEEANISCSLYNLGRVKMYNVKARFEGKMIDTQEQFIGNLDAGATGTIDAIVTAKKATKGSEECKLVLTYEDDAGNVSTAEQKFKMTVLEETAVEETGMMPEAVPEESGNPVGLAAAVLAVIAAAAAGTVIFIKHRKKKIREAEEEEMFDEVERFTEDEH